MFLAWVISFPILSFANPSNPLPFSTGEKITYSIKKFGIKTGTATLEFNGLTQFKGHDVLLITFTARGLKFYDQEQIYMSPENWYPLFVKRDLNIWGKKEKIIEEYDPKNGEVKITILRGKKTIERIIEKKGVLDNIYCFIYRYRRDQNPQIGDSFSVDLPTKNLTINLVKKMRLKAARKVYEAFYMKSTPSKYEIWFDTSEKMIPLRINGAIGISHMGMVMVDYQDQ